MFRGPYVISHRIAYVFGDACEKPGGRDMSHGTKPGERDMSHGTAGRAAVHFTDITSTVSARQLGNAARTVRDTAD